MIVNIFFRKLGSFVIQMDQRLRTCFSLFIIRIFREGIQVGKKVSFARGISLKATDGGRVILGHRVSLGKNTRIESKQGTVNIGDNVFIGDGCIIIAQNHIEIGANSQIAEYVVIRDQDHNFTTRPIKDAGFETSPVFIGEDVWIGCKATVLRGSTIGKGAVVAAHSLIRGDVPPYTLVAGTPAKVKKYLS